MSLKQANVGPVDVASYLASIRAGKIKPLPPVEVDVILDAAGAVEYNALCDRFNALALKAEDEAAQEQSIAGELTGNHAAELDQLEKQIGVLEASAKLRGRFAFRGYEAGDTDAVQAAVKELPEADRTLEIGAALEIAYYSVDPNPKKLAADTADSNLIAMGKLALDDVRAIIPVIGYNQWQTVKAAYQGHVYGVPTAPKLLRPLRSPGTKRR